MKNMSVAIETADPRQDNRTEFGSATMSLLGNIDISWMPRFPLLAIVGTRYSNLLCLAERYLNSPETMCDLTQSITNTRTRNEEPVVRNEKPVIGIVITTAEDGYSAYSETLDLSISADTEEEAEESMLEAIREYFDLLMEDKSKLAPRLAQHLRYKDSPIERIRGA